LTPYPLPDKINISTHKEDIMKALGVYFAEMFKSATSGPFTIQSEWDKARSDASRFGPSHVAEIDAIFSRQA
jgi:hypothetical protein